jgi:hypothetical protein
MQGLPKDHDCEDEEDSMAIQLDDTAPDFTAQTTEGRLSLHEYLGDGCGIPVLPPRGLYARMHHRIR